MTSGDTLAQTIAEYASERKALEIVQLDLRGIISYTDYFVICTGRSDRQTKAIHDGIHLGMKDEHGILPTAWRASRRRGGSSWTISTSSSTCSRLSCASSTVSSSSGERLRPWHSQAGRGRTGVISA